MQTKMRPSLQAVGKVDQIASQDSRACPSSCALATHQRISGHKCEVSPRGNHDQDGETSNTKEVCKHAVALIAFVHSFYHFDQRFDSRMSTQPRGGSRCQAHEDLSCDRSVLPICSLAV